MNKEEFVNKMYETDLVYDDIDLRDFADEHFQNLLSFEENKESFLKYIEVEDE